MNKALAKVKPKQVAVPARPVGPPAADPEILRAWSPRKPLILGLIAIALLVGGLGFWAVTTTLSGAIVANGMIEVESNRQAVQHPDGGVVDELLVREGDVVEAGQVLIRLDRERLSSELSIIESQLFKLMAQRGLFEAERDGAAEITFDPELLAAADRYPEIGEMLDSNRRLFAQRAENLASSTEQLGKRKAQIASQIEGLNAQFTAIEEQLALVEQELTGQVKLQEQGLAQLPKVLALQREKSRLLGASGEIVASIAQSEGQITEIDLEIQKLQAQMREDAIAQLSQQEGNELELAERRRALLEQLNRLDIRAPVAGAVHELSVFGERSVIRPAEPILFIVPQDRPLVIGVQVETIHIDQVHVGQEVMLRFSAFDTRRTPEILGRVISVSPDAIHDERTGRSFYRARVEISEGETEKLPEGSVLVPGMPVQAYLKTGEHSPAGYLLKPFTDYFSTAFREN